MPRASTTDRLAPDQSDRFTAAPTSADSTRWFRACLPAALASAIVLLAWVTGVRSGTPLWWSLVGASGLLALWNALLVWLSSATRPRGFLLDVALRKQHYLQACAQGCVLLYWGWYWRPVYDVVPLLAAQLLFAYAFDILLVWSRRDRYTLGFGPVPVVFSTNLFLWFKPEWFGLQFAMLAVGFAAKEWIRWTRDGRRVHIFNPSSFPLAIFSLGLIAAGASDLTRGQDIAISQFYPPQMYLVLFLVGLPGQFFFGVASMTLSAVATTYVLGLAYFTATGIYFFYDSYVPIAVFLGMHLLFTDPSTSPRSELGRVMFGALYGASSMLLYLWLGAVGVPAFYDKLLQVPILNLSVRWLDRLAASPWLRPVDPARLGRSFTLRQRHVAYMVAWVGTFSVLSAGQGVGDGHPGQWVPFWERACGEGRQRACLYLADLEAILCDAGSGWACNESALRLLDPSAGASTARAVQVREVFDRGCRVGFVPACKNARREMSEAETFERAPPTLGDLPILVRGSKGPVSRRAADDLYARACEIGWSDVCGRAVVGQ